MEFLGDLERFAATSLFPNRYPLAALALAGVVILAVVGVRRGWVAAARRHPARTGMVLGAAILLVAPVTWYVASPLFLRSELNEPPLAAVATPAPGTVGPATTPQPSGSPPVVAPASPPAATPPPQVRTGAFAGADDFHFGRGSATLTVAPDGRHTLRFDDFSVQNGPDLFVYLSPDPAGYTDDAVELGRLRATDGSFSTPIPVGLDVSGARSVVIWCKEFGVLFAVAPLAG
jgi:hypothetical protein